MTANFKEPDTGKMIHSCPQCLARDGTITVIECAGADCLICGPQPPEESNGTFVITSVDRKNELCADDSESRNDRAITWTE